MTYAEKIDKAEAQIDWTRPAPAVAAQIRALSPFPGAWCDSPIGRLKLLDASAVEGQGEPGEVLGGLTIACGTDAVQVHSLQRQGKRASTAEAFLNGHRFAPGTRLPG